MALGRKGSTGGIPYFVNDYDDSLMCVTLSKKSTTGLFLSQIFRCKKQKNGTLQKLHKTSEPGWGQVQTHHTTLDASVL